MKRSTLAVGAVLAIGAIGAAAARGPAKAHMAEGTMPGRTGSWLNSYTMRPSYRLIADKVALGPDDDLLDVACGWGEFLVVHGAKARKVAGIDWSERKASLARARLADRIAAGTAEVVHGDAANLPWAEDTFTAVTCMDAFAFFPDPPRILAEILRVLQPGGRMVMQIGMRWPDGPPKRLPHPVNQAVDVGDEAAVRELVENAGFQQVRISYGRVAGDSRLGGLASRLDSGSDEIRIVAAAKSGSLPVAPTP